VLIEEEVEAVLASELVRLIIGVLAVAAELTVEEGVPERGTMEDEAVIPILLPMRGCKGIGIPDARMECMDAESRLLLEEDECKASCNSSLSIDEPLLASVSCCCCCC